MPCTVLCFSLNFLHVVAHIIWRRRGVFPRRCRAHLLQKRERLSCLLVSIDTRFDLLHTARHSVIRVLAGRAVCTSSRQRKAGRVVHGPHWPVAWPRARGRTAGHHRHGVAALPRAEARGCPGRRCRHHQPAPPRHVRAIGHRAPCSSPLLSCVPADLLVISYTSLSHGTMGVQAIQEATSCATGCRTGAAPAVEAAPDRDTQGDGTAEQGDRGLACGRPDGWCLAVLVRRPGGTVPAHPTGAPRSPWRRMPTVWHISRRPGEVAWRQASGRNVHHGPWRS